MTTQPGDTQPGVGRSGVAPPEVPAAPARLRRWPSPTRFTPHTLAGRLLAGVLALVVIVVLGIGFGTYELLKPFLIQRLDQQVAQTAAGDRRLLTNAHCMPDPSSAQVLCSFPSDMSQAVPQTQWLNIYSSSGTPQLLSFGNSTALRVLNLTPATANRLVSNPNATATVQTTDGRQVRVMARPFEDGFVAVFGLSMDDVNQPLHRLFLLEVAIGGVAVALAILATGYGVGAVLRPLNRVRRTAADVAAELSPQGRGLERRVDITPDELGTEAGQVAVAVNTMLDAVETQFAARVASEERMRQFLADASHELRTPLTSIRGYAELARLRGDGSIDAETMQRVEAEGTRMSRLVEDLFLLARHDQGSMAEPQLVDMGEVAQHAVDGATVSYPDRPIVAQVAAPAPVWGDPDQLLRVVRNLVNNAAVHTAPGGPITLDVRPEGADAVLRVIDAGPGLPPEEAAHVFERFWRADKARTRARGGSGLGMSIVSSLVEAHRGSVQFASSVESGSTVTVRVPLALPGVVPGESRPAGSATMQR